MIFLRRRWIKKANPMTNRKPATTRMIVAVSMMFLLSPRFSNSKPENQFKNLAKPRTMMIAEGPIVTTNRDGKMNRTSGNTSLTVVFAACSSAS